MTDANNCSDLATRASFDYYSKSSRQTLTVILLQLGLHQLCPDNFEILSIINWQAKALSIMPALYSRTIFETFFTHQNSIQIISTLAYFNSILYHRNKNWYYLYCFSSLFAFFYKKIEVL